MINFDIKAASTSDLHSAAEIYMLNGQWADARALLDELGTRRNVPASIAPVANFEEVCGRYLHPEYRQLLQDRVDLVNSKVR
jgi:hypothetical protein